jgi:charged multivesicular body protein 1
VSFLALSACHHSTVTRVDAVSSRVETAVTMRKVTNNMTTVVRQMDKAMESMNLERVCSLPPFNTDSANEQQISMVMEKFEGQFEDLDVQTSYMESAMGESAAVSTPQDQVDLLMSQVADEAGIEREQAVTETQASLPELKEAAKEPVEEDQLATRLRALRQSA